MKTEKGRVSAGFNGFLSAAGKADAPQAGRWQKGYKGRNRKGRRHGNAKGNAIAAAVAAAIAAAGIGKGGRRPQNAPVGRMIVSHKEQVEEGKTRVRKDKVTCMTSSDKAAKVLAKATMSPPAVTGSMRAKVVKAPKGRVETKGAVKTERILNYMAEGKDRREGATKFMCKNAKKTVTDPPKSLKA